MYKNILLELGLNKNESSIYEYILKNGGGFASDIIRNTKIKKAVAYDNLKLLEEKGVITIFLKNKKKFFSPNHPNTLKVFIDRKEEQILKVKNILNKNINEMISDFNLISEKPNITIYENIDGIKKNI